MHKHKAVGVLWSGEESGGCGWGAKHAKVPVGGQGRQQQLLGGWKAGHHLLHQGERGEGEKSACWKF